MSFPDEDDLPEDYGHLAEYGGINKNNKRQSSLSEQAQWEKIADIRKTTQDKFYPIDKDDLYITPAVHDWWRPNVYWNEISNESRNVKMAWGIFLFLNFLILGSYVVDPDPKPNHGTSILVGTIMGAAFWAVAFWFEYRSCYAWLAPRASRKELWLKFGISCPKCLKLAEPRYHNKYECYNPDCDVQQFTGAVHGLKQ